jgi:hypothetical protein
VAEVVALVDYGAGNLHSVHNALKAAGAATAPALPTFFHPRDPPPVDLEEVEQENFPSA